MQLLPSEKSAALIESILSQAKCFLDDADEFYPFGSVVDNKLNIKPVSIFMDEEFPNSSEVLQKLEDGIRAGIQKKGYLAAAIGIDVFLKVEKQGLQEKHNAIEVRIFDLSAYETKYFLYHKENNQYIIVPYQS